jgi:glycosyltransferase involved in cell wall biosynthesis
MQNVFIIIPFYNEEKILQFVLNQFKNKIGYKIILVNDGSTDNSIFICSNYKFTLLNHKNNLGQGAALRTGILYAIENNADIICTFDSDGQHKLTDLDNMIEKFKISKVDIILGSRFLNSNKLIPFKRKILLKFAIFFQFILIGGKFTDVHNGLRVFSRSAALKLNLSADKMEHASFIISSILKNKLTYLEFPVEIIYTNYSINKGQKLPQIIKIGLNLLKLKIMNKL